MFSMFSNYNIILIVIVELDNGDVKRNYIYIQIFICTDS